MLSEFRFFLNIIGFRFADALASHPESWQLRGDWELWAAYRLGLYRTVAENGWRRRIRHGGRRRGFIGRLRAFGGSAGSCGATCC